MKNMFTLVCLAILPFSYIAAEGYQANTQSTKQLGMGHVGTALKLGAESMHFNPAGLGFMDKQIDLSAGVSCVFSNAKYTHDDYVQKSDNKQGTPLYVYAGFKIYDFLSAGISVNTPYGSSMNWGVNWKGSHLIQDIMLKSYSIQPTLAYKITDRLSVGAGMMMMFGNFSMSRALIPAGKLDGLIALKPYIPTIGETLDHYKDVAAASTILSGDAALKLGFNVGVMFDLNDKISLGVSYRSKVMMNVNEGHGKLSYPNENELKGLLDKANPFLGDNAIRIPAFDQGTFSASLPLPSNFNVGVGYKPTRKLLISGEVQFVGWAAYKELFVKFSEDALSPFNRPVAKNYRNTRIYRLGGQYAATNRLDVRFGTYFDESPIRADNYNPETPSMNKLGLTTGLSFRPVERLSVDMAFSYVTGFGRDGSYTDIDLTTGKERTFGGLYDTYAITPSVGVSYRF